MATESLIVKWDKQPLRVAGCAWQWENEKRSDTP